MPGLSILESLDYAFLFHPNASSDKLSSPTSLIEEYGIEGDYVAYSKIMGRVQLKDWASISGFFEKGGCYYKNHTHDGIFLSFSFF